MTYKIWFTNWRKSSMQNPRRRPELKVKNVTIARKVCDGLRKAGYQVFMAWND